MNLYHVLELNNDASTINIKKSYRRLAKIYHPDKNKGEDEQFKKVSFAYEILSDDELRKDYDSKLCIHEPYDLLQNIITKNKLNIINSIFGYIYDDNATLRNDINNFNITNIYNNIKCKFDLDINNEIFINIKDLYFNKEINIMIKRKINNEFKNFSMRINPDIYDEELQYDNLGDEHFFIRGHLNIKIKLDYDEELYNILDNYNLLIVVKDLNYKLFDSINLIELKRITYFTNEKYIIYQVKNYGFLNNDTNKKGDLFIKIYNII